MKKKSPYLILFSVLTLFSTGCGEQDNESPDRSSTQSASPIHLSQLTNSLGAELIFLEGGSFTMGSPGSEKRRGLDENLHQVTLTEGFYCWNTEVTQKQWKDIMQTEPWVGGAYSRSGDKLPAGAMSIGAAKEFCEKLTALETDLDKLPKGFGYRLPTEAEWEYACRAGTKTRFSCGNDDQSLKQHARFALNSEGQGVLPVATRKPNAWGLHDMHGNVWELCLDQVEWEVGPNAIRHLVNEVYQEGIADPLSTKGSEFVRRGGAWNTQDYACRSANRSADEGTGEWPDLGFRPVLARIIR